MKLVFLSYINRSGSSFLAQKLSELEDIFVFPEGDILIDKLLLKNDKNTDDIRKQFSQLIHSDNKLKYWNITDTEMDNIFSKKSTSEVFMQFLYTYKNKIKPNASILIFKRSNIYSSYNQIKIALSNYDVSLLCLYRDPRAIFSSQKDTIDPATNKPFNINPVITANNWNEYCNFIMKYSDCISASFENIVNDFDIVLPKLLSKLSVSNHKSSSKTYFDIIPSDQKEIHKEISLPPQKDKTEKWKINLPESEQKIIEYICNTNLKKISYPITFQKLDFNSYFKLMYFKIRILLGVDKY